MRWKSLTLLSSKLETVFLLVGGILVMDFSKRISLLDISRGPMDLKKNDCPSQKIPFETRSDALEYARHIRVQRKFRSKILSGGKNNKKIRAYMCPMCGKWHLSTRTARKGYGAKAR